MILILVKSNFLVLGIANRGILFYDYVTGKCLLKQRQKDIEFCKCSSNGKQIASKTSKKSIYISDIVRGHAIKVLKYQVEKDEEDEDEIRFKSELIKIREKIFLLYEYGNFIYILDIVSAKIVKRNISNIKLNSTMSFFAS